MPAAANSLTLVEVARRLYPHALGDSGYYRLYQQVRRHRRECPVQFSYLRSPHNGRNVMVMFEADVPKLKQWLEDRS